MILQKIAGIYEFGKHLDVKNVDFDNKKLMQTNNDVSIHVEISLQCITCTMYGEREGNILITNQV